MYFYSVLNDLVKCLNDCVYPDSYALHIQKYRKYAH